MKCASERKFHLKTVRKRELYSSSVILNTSNSPSLDHYLHALIEELDEVAVCHQLFNVMPQALRQATKKIKRHNHEVFVRGFILVRVREVGL
jgi:hypothetical protein